MRPTGVDRFAHVAATLTLVACGGGASLTSLQDPESIVSREMGAARAAAARDLPCSDSPLSAAVLVGRQDHVVVDGCGQRVVYLFLNVGNQFVTNGMPPESPVLIGRFARAGAAAVATTPPPPPPPPPPSPAPVASVTPEPRVWRTEAVPTFADVALTVSGRTIHFAKSCDDAHGSLASSITSRKPRRPVELNVTGCDGTYAYFHLWLQHPDQPGPATPSLFDVTLPGVELQELTSAARFEITQVTEDRVAGTFEVDIRPANGARPVQARGLFDVPRRPDETSPGP